MLTIIDADLNNPAHGKAIFDLLNHYAQDPMGGAEPLSEYCRDNLITELRKRSTIHMVLAYWGDQAAGVMTCIEGFSTFAAKPLLNVHDVAVHSAFRGKGIARAMFAHVDQLAQRLGCCKITLEVLQGNRPALALYTDVGFVQYELDPSTGGAILMQKKLM